MYEVRHIIVRHHGGLDPRLLGEPEPLVCDCHQPAPVRLDGIWWGLDLYQCRWCGRKALM